MIRFSAVVAQFGDLREPELHDWIARGWVHPDPADEGDFEFADIDIARVSLIRDLRHVMAVDEETMPVVLGLLDQVYDLRRTLRRVLRALDDQPASARAAVVAALRR